MTSVTDDTPTSGDAADQDRRAWRLLAEELRELGEVAGTTVFDDPDHLRAALDDYMDEAQSPARLHLLVDAVRMGAASQMTTALDNGATARAAVSTAARFLAVQRICPIDSATYAIAALAHGAGRVSWSEAVDRGAPSPPLPLSETIAPIAAPAAPPTVATPPPPFAPRGGAGAPTVARPVQTVGVGPYIASPRPRRRWMAVVAITVVVAAAGITTAVVLGHDRRSADPDDLSDLAVQNAAVRSNLDGYSVIEFDPPDGISDDVTYVVELPQLGRSIEAPGSPVSVSLPSGGPYDAIVTPMFADGSSGRAVTITGLDPVVVPLPVVQSESGGYSVEFEAAKVADDELDNVEIQWNEGAGFSGATLSYTRRVTVDHAGDRACVVARFHATTSTGDAVVGREVRACGRALEESVDFHRGVRCDRKEYVPCFEYELELAGFRPSVPIVATLVNSDGSLACKRSCARSEIAIDGRGSTTYAPWLGSSGPGDVFVKIGQRTYPFR